MAVFYLNQGLILEQAIVALIHEYLEVCDVDGLYKNFHVDVTNSHPFASLYLHNNLNASDMFPSIVVSTQNDDKTADLAQLPVDVHVVGLNEKDIEELTRTTYKEGFKNLHGETVKTGTKIPGLCSVTSPKVIADIKAILDNQEYIYGIDCITRRTDRISIEVWADNEQVKNELYEIIRLFLSGGLITLLEQRYKNFDPSIFDHSIHGQRSGNYNMDFGTALAGANITFEVNYCIRQVILDAEITTISEVIPEAHNYVKANR